LLCRRVAVESSCNGEMRGSNFLSFSFFLSFLSFLFFLFFILPLLPLLIPQVRLRARKLKQGHMKSKLGMMSKMGMGKTAKMGHAAL